MEKVDKLIEDLADHISGILKSNAERNHEVAEKTKALADLISARARMDYASRFSVELSPIKDVHSV